MPFPALLRLSMALTALGACRKPPAHLEVTSPAIAAGGAMPARYVCTGRGAHDGMSPPLAWSAPPPGTKTLAVVMDDQDARGFIHWVVTNLPPDTRVLAEAISPGGALPRGAQEGPNGWEQRGYAGPCPPPGPAHHYIIRVFALEGPMAPPHEADRGFVRLLEKKALAIGQLTIAQQR